MLLVCMLTLSGCHGARDAAPPGSAPVYLAPATQIAAAAGVAETAGKDLASSGRALAATTQRTGDLVAAGEALMPRIPEAPIRDQLWRIWGGIREQLGAGARAIGELVTLQEHVQGLQQRLGAAQQQLADAQAAHEEAIASVRRAATTQATADAGTIRGLQDKVRALDESVSREAQRAGFWTILGAGGVFALGIFVMVWGSKLGLAIAIGGVALGGYNLVAIQVMRTADAMNATLKWGVPAVAALLIADLAWSLYQRRRTASAGAAKLDREASEAASKGDHQAAAQKMREATAAWRTLDPEYNAEWLKAKLRDLRGKVGW
jgi:hypothetical protein